jgi:hypothetical protein
MKLRKFFVFACVMGLALVLASISTRIGPIKAQGPGQGSQPTPEQNLSKRTPTLPLELKTRSSSPSTSTIDIPVDIVLMQDETGSMSDDISTLKSLAPDIWDAIAAMSTAGFRMSVVGFRDYAQSGWGDSGDWVYRLIRNFASSRDEFVAGVNSLTASRGGDGPESQ